MNNWNFDSRLKIFMILDPGVLPPQQLGAVDQTGQTVTWFGRPYTITEGIIQNIKLSQNSAKKLFI